MTTNTSNHTGPQHSDEAARLPVVVGADGSGPNASAVAWAAAEAAGRDRELVLLCAVGEDIIPGTPWSSPEMDAAARAVLERVRRDVLRDHPLLRVRAEVAVGAAPAVLIGSGDDRELVVVGRRGHGGFARLLIGSTSLAAAGHARGPVVVVPQDWDAATHGRGAVVLAVDPQRPDPDALRFAFERARRLGRPLRAVATWQVPSFMTRESSGIQDLWDECERGAGEQLERVLRPWAPEFPDVHVTAAAIHGHPAGALLEELGDAELLVVAPRARGSLGGFRLGSVSRALLQHATLPVAVIHPPETVVTPAREEAGQEAGLPAELADARA